MSARRTYTAIMLAIMLGQAVPSSAQDAVRSPKASATDTDDAFSCGARRPAYWLSFVRPKPAPPDTDEQQYPRCDERRGAEAWESLGRSRRSADPRKKKK